MLQYQQTYAPDVFSPLVQAQFGHRRNRLWRKHLTSVERDVLDYLMDNTIGWRRTTVCATLKQMVTGTHWLPEIGLSIATVQRTMASLVKRGLVWVHSESSRATHTYEVNLSWEPDMARNPGVAVPKRKQPSVDGNIISGLFGNDTDQSINLISATYQSDTPLKEKAIKGKLEEESKPASRAAGEWEEVQEVQPAAIPVTAADVVLAMQQGTLPMLPRIRTRPVAKPDPAAFEKSITPVPPKKLPANVSSVTNDIAWRKGWAAGFPGVPVMLLPPAERGMLNQNRLRVESLGNDWFKFFEWSITNWRHVIRSKFGWMTKSPAPQFPDVKFFCTTKFTNLFLEAFAEQEEHEVIKALPGEAGERRRLHSRGLSHDEITRELGRQQAARERAAKTDAAEEHMARQMRALEKAQEAAEAERKRFIEAAAKARTGVSMRPQPRVAPPEPTISIEELSAQVAALEEWK